MNRTVQEGLKLSQFEGEDKEGGTLPRTAVLDTHSSRKRGIPGQRDDDRSLPWSGACLIAKDGGPLPGAAQLPSAAASLRIACAQPCLLQLPGWWWPTCAVPHSAAERCPYAPTSGFWWRLVASASPLPVSWPSCLQKGPAASGQASEVGSWMGQIGFALHPWNSTHPARRTSNHPETPPRQGPVWS